MRLISIILLILAASLPLAALDPSKPLTSYQRQTWQTENGLPQNTVHAIVQTRDGYLWLATEGGLVRFDGSKFTVYDSQNTPSIRSNNIRALFEDRQQNLWIGTADGLTVFRAAGKKIFTREQGLPSNSVWSISQDGGDHLLVVTAGGPAEYRDGKFTAKATKEAIESTGTAMLRDSEGGLWTSNRGLQRLLNGGSETLPANDPLANDTILCIFEDREGDIWLGTESSGVTELRDAKFTTYTTKQGLTNDQARCVYQDRQGALWFGTNGGLTKMASGKVEQFTVADGLSSDLIFALGENAAADLLVGTQDGLNIIHAGTVSILTTADGLADDLVRSLHTDSDGAVWIGTRRGLTVWENSRFHTYTQADGLASDFVGALTRGRDGSLWIGTLRGLTRFREGRFTTLSSNTVTALYEDSGGALWIGTQDSGLQRLQNGKLFQYRPALGLPTSIYAIVENGGFIWLTSKTGIFRIPKAELDAAASTGSAFSLTQYGTADGMRVNECSEGGHPAAWRSKDGTLWFATMRGVSSIQGPASKLNGRAPPAVVESFAVDDKVVDLTRRKEIQPGQERLSFEYTGISFVSPQRVRFRYRLEGFDRAWVEAGTRRTAYYTSLPPGDYRFRVAARANDGGWTGPEAAVAFRLLPHFYQTAWFYLLVAAALGISVYVFYRWRVSEVEAQFNAVLAERNRIAREIHDTLAQGFVAISLQLELLGRKLENAPAEVSNLIQQAKGLVQYSLTEARRSIWELRSQASETDDLRARLSKIATEVTQGADLKVRFQVLGTYRALPENIENELLKIGQEALTNVVRHANAKQVKVDLVYEGKKVRLTISDDGQGFAGAVNSSGPDGHFGLRGMRERAANIGAQLHVTSGPTEGTEIDVEKIVS